MTFTTSPPAHTLIFAYPGTYLIGIKLQGVDQMSEDKGFVVKDRRRFKEGADDAEPAEERTEDREPTEEASREPTDRPEPGPTADSACEEPEIPLPELTFAGFLVSLSTSVAVHLGLVAEPTTGETRKDLALAKQTIDLLGLLQEKTRGNLTEEEDKLFQSILFDLRLQYVNACK